MGSEKNIATKQCSRREVLKGLAFAAGLGAMQAIPSAASAASFSKSMLVDGKRHIYMRHLHTGEVFDGVYKVGDQYVPEAFEEINKFLRDFRTGDVYPIDPRVLDIIWHLNQKTNGKYPFEILSGYRSAKTNKRLSRSTDGVALNSLHMAGQAIDIRLPYYSTKKLRNLAVDLQSGGVGYYPTSDFVHLDTGDVRTW